MGVHVTQYAAFYNEDCSAVPADFVPTPVLERSVLDFVELPPTVGGRKLPLLRDILDRLYEGAKDADYLIYSNIDIGLRPDFYLEVARLIEDGSDAFLIGRRIVSTEFNHPMIWRRSSLRRASHASASAVSCFRVPTTPITFSTTPASGCNRWALHSP